MTFDNGLKAEIAPTDHAAAMRFTYPDANANLIFDNVNNNGGLTIDAASRSFSGFSDVRAGQDGATRMFVYGTLDAPVTASGTLAGGGGANVTGYVKVDAGASKTVTVRLATSLISVDQAKKNLAMEIPDSRTFDQVRDAAQDAWDQVLGRVEVEGATADQLTTLYSNLYRLYLYPNSAFENTGTAAAPKYQYASPVQPAAASTPTQTGAKVVDGQDVRQQRVLGHLPHHVARLLAAHAEQGRRRWSTGSPSSTATAAGSPAGRRRATPTS